MNIDNILDEQNVYQYTVFWIDFTSITQPLKIKFFANKKEAKKFAKKRIKRNNPRPFITQSITTRSSFKKDIRCEICNKKFKTDFEYANHYKFIKV